MGNRVCAPQTTALRQQLLCSDFTRFGRKLSAPYCCRLPADEPGSVRASAANGNAERADPPGRRLGAVDATAGDRAQARAGRNRDVPAGAGPDSTPQQSSDHRSSQCNRVIRLPAVGLGNGPGCAAAHPRGQGCGRPGRQACVLDALLLPLYLRAAGAGVASQPNVGDSSPRAAHPSREEVARSWRWRVSRATDKARTGRGGRNTLGFDLATRMPSLARERSLSIPWVTGLRGGSPAQSMSLSGDGDASICGCAGSPDVPCRCTEPDS
jgi:hypothetical protein